MADRGVKKVIVKAADLPTLNSDLLGYYVRFRMASEDRNRLSHWSPTYLMEPEYSFYGRTGLPVAQENNIVANKNNQVLNIAWDPVVLYLNDVPIRDVVDFDIWLKLYDNHDDGIWQHYERVSTNSAEFLVPNSFPSSEWTEENPIFHEDSPNRVNIEVYVSGDPIQRFDTGVEPLPTEYAPLKVYQLYSITI